MYLPGVAGVSGVVTFLGVEYYPRGGSGYFKELALIFKVELKFKVCKYRFDDLLDFTPNNLQSIENQFHTFSIVAFSQNLRVLMDLVPHQIRKQEEDLVSHLTCFPCF